MKKTIKSLLLGLILVFAVVLTSCGETCEHVSGASWRTNETDHWKICEKCQNDVEKAAHTYGEWKTVTEAAVGIAGKEYRQCSVCGYINERTIPALVVETGVATEDTAVYVKAPADWETVNCYFFGEDKTALDYTVGWPGAVMTCVDETENIWGYVVAPGTGYVIFNNGSSQTADLLFATKLNYYKLGDSKDSEGKLLADYDTYTPAADQPELNTYPKEIEEETFKTIYVQIPEGWSNVNIHNWGGKGTEWPGVALTAVDAEKRIYSYELSSRVTGFLFVTIVNGEPGSQTVNLAPNDDVNGYVVAADCNVTEAAYADGTFTPVDTGPVEVYVRGGMNSWGTPDEYKLIVDGTTATITLTIEANTEFKVATAAWSCEIGFGKLVDVDATLFTDAGGNIKCLVTGTYTITVTNYTSNDATATIVAVTAE